MRAFLLLASLSLVLASLAAAVEGPGRLDDLPYIELFQPQKKAKVPIKAGEYRCDNIYHGVILPCLLRPDLPPFSYLPAFAYNTEYRKRRSLRDDLSTFLRVRSKQLNHSKLRDDTPQRRSQLSMP